MDASCVTGGCQVDRAALLVQHFPRVRGGDVESMRGGVSFLALRMSAMNVGRVEYPREDVSTPSRLEPFAGGRKANKKMTATADS